MPPHVFDPTRYPRTYKPWLPLRIACGLLGGLIFAGAGGAFVDALLEQFRQPTLPGLSGCLFDLAASVAGYVFAMSLLRARIVVAPMSIELRTLWTTRRVMRRDILDCELFSRGSSGDGFRVNASTLERTMASAMPFHFDNAFRAWFAGLPDARKVEATRNLEAIERDDALGGNAWTRLADAERARNTTRLLGRAIIFLACWTCFYPHPRTILLTLTAACPWLLLWLCWRSKGLFSLAANTHSGRGELFTVHVIAIVALGWRAMEDVTLANGTTLFLWSLVVAVPMTVLLFAACRDLRTSSFTKKLLNSALLLLYAVSALDLANREFDDAPGEAQRVSVVGRRISHTRSRPLYLKLAPTPADMASPEIEVSSDLYSRTHVGGHVCLVERDGALGWHWIQIMAESACPAN